MKLVNSAETIFQRLYGHIDDEQKLFIDQWLCLKQEYDSVCNNSTLDSCENLDESSMLSPIGLLLVMHFFFFFISTFHKSV